MITVATAAVAAAVTAAAAATVVVIESIHCMSNVSYVRHVEICILGPWNHVTNRVLLNGVVGAVCVGVTHRHIGSFHISPEKEGGFVT